MLRSLYHRCKHYRFRAVMFTPRAYMMVARKSNRHFTEMLQIRKSRLSPFLHSPVRILSARACLRFVHLMLHGIQVFKCAVTDPSKIASSSLGNCSFDLTGSSRPSFHYLFPSDCERSVALPFRHLLSAPGASC